jgi:hypothetical protein
VHSFCDDDASRLFHHTGESKGSLMHLIANVNTRNMEHSALFQFQTICKHVFFPDIIYTCSMIIKTIITTLFVVHLLDDTSALRRRMAPGAGYGRD